MVISNEISKQEKEFKVLCETHKVKSLYAFGSSVNESFDFAKSDIDLLVEIDDNDPIERGEMLMSLWDKFETFFHRKVDLLTDASIKNPFLRNSIDASKVLIYDGSRKEILV
jgi:predicted nucleotidyltransferase